jgi:hypothetical protein
MELSNEARAIFLGCFLNPKSTLRLANVENTLTDAARKGMDELIEAGLVEAFNIAGTLAVIYSATEAGMNADRKEIAGGDLFGFMETHGKFNLFQSIMKGGAA